MKFWFYFLIMDAMIFYRTQDFSDFKSGKFWWQGAAGSTDFFMYLHDVESIASDQRTQPKSILWSNHRSKASLQ